MIPVQEMSGKRVALILEELGAREGLASEAQLLKPSWQQLKESKIWGKAFSLSPDF